MWPHRARGPSVTAYSKPDRKARSDDHHHRPPPLPQPQRRAHRRAGRRRPDRRPAARRDVVLPAVVPDDEVVWLGPWIDYPILTLLLTGVVLKLATALAPGLDAALRIRRRAGRRRLGVVVTLLKMPLYGEPEGVTFLVLDGLLGWLLLRARRTA